jgi:hypothetical protein
MTSPKVKRSEREEWIAACLASLCAAYNRQQITYGVAMPEYCAHPWCHGVVDVITRALTREEWWDEGNTT